MLLLMHAQNVTVIAFASVWVGEDGVGFGNLGKPCGGVGVSFIDVWMGLAGQGVELSVDGEKGLMMM